MNNEKQWAIDFGARLRAERERHGLTRAALAKLAGTDAAYLLRLENGTKNPSFRMLRSLISALGVSADFLIYGVRRGGYDVQRDGGTAESEADTDVKQSALRDIVELLEKRCEEEVAVLYRLIKGIVQYRGM